MYWEAPKLSICFTLSTSSVQLHPLFPKGPHLGRYFAASCSNYLIRSLHLRRSPIPHASHSSTHSSSALHPRSIQRRNVGHNTHRLDLSHSSHFAHRTWCALANCHEEAVPIRISLRSFAWLQAMRLGARTGSQDPTPSYYDLRIRIRLRQCAVTACFGFRVCTILETNCINSSPAAIACGSAKQAVEA